MLFVDIALRGATIGLLGLLAALMWRAPIGWEGRLSITMVAIAKSAFLLTHIPISLNMPPLVEANLLLLASLVPNAVTWLIVTIFLDPPGRRWPWLVASSVVSVLFYLTHTSPPLLDGMICAAAAMVLYTALFGLALWSSRDDLVECRCKARPGFAAAIAGLGMVLTGLEVFGPTITPSGLISLLQPAGTFAVAAAFAVWILRPDLSRWPGENEDTRPTPSIANPQTADLDPALTSRVTAAMEDGIWREEGLTIGALAARLSVPEHRLRRVINGGLGHRNFSSFINTARIEAAKQRLRDPSECGTTVLEIAYDVGFASLGPFNRAFRTETGQSPTEYRKDASGLHADSEHHAPMPANLH